MDKEKKVTRITLDLPAKTHKRLKTLAAMRETSMREIIIDALNLHLKNMQSEEFKSKIKDAR